MLRQVHGHPLLCLPQAQDTRSHQDHHCGGQGSADAELRARHIELAATAVAATELRELSLQATSASPGPAMPPSSDAFKAVEDAKTMQIDAEDPTKTVQIRTGLNPKIGR
jgi:hypothetical protein